MLETFSTELLEDIFDTLPVEVSFVDDADTVRYYSNRFTRILTKSRPFYPYYGDCILLSALVPT